MTDKELIAEARELLMTYSKMECMQPLDGWTEESCAELGCPFLDEGEDCTWQTRAVRFVSKTRKDDWWLT